MVSVIVPIYNVEAYLRECLDSIARQTFDDLEVIMVNDMSSDGSSHTAAEYAARDKRFRLIGKKNGGPSSARNAGIAAAEGDMVMFVDSDDVIHKEAVSILVNSLRNSNADMSMCDIVQTNAPRYRISTETYCKTGLDLLIDTLYRKKATHTGVVGRIIRRSVLEKVGLFKEGIYYEDLHYCFDLYLNCRTVAINKSYLYYYRRTPGSITNKWTPKRLDVLDVADEMVVKAEQIDNNLKMAAEARRFNAYYNMFLLSAANGYSAGVERCLPVIKALRKQMLADSNVRLKGKLGAILSYAGPRVMSLFA